VDHAPTRARAANVPSVVADAPDQKGGIVAKVAGTDVDVINNTVTGLGAVKFIAQNGIQVSSGASADVTGNTVSKNQYTGGGWTATGILFYQAGTTPKTGKISSTNRSFNNQANVAVIK
jgi:filamentous hemagglutinin family protein